MEDIVSIEAGKGPVDLEALAVDGLVPGTGFGAEFAQEKKVPDDISSLELSR